MIATAHDLPLRGNYFAESDFLRQDLAAGTIHNRAGARMFAAPDDLLVALHNVIADEFGSQSDAVLKAMGREWGRRAAVQFTEEMAKHHGRVAAELPLSVFTADLTAAFLHHGWGRYHFDYSRFSRGILEVDVFEPFVGAGVKDAGTNVESLASGFLSGMFSQFSGTELDCLQTSCRAKGAAKSCYVLTLPERVAAVANMVAAGKPHAEVIAELEKTTVAPE